MFLRNIFPAVSLLCIFAASAKDLVVSVKSLETLQPLAEMDVTLYDRNNNLLGHGVMNHADTTYVIKGADNYPCRVNVTTPGSIFSENMETPRDTLLLLLPITFRHKELKPVEVKAISAYIKDDRTVYLPSRREKNGASGGASLLRNMALAQITVDPVNDAIRTASGDGVAVYIDYLPASPQEVSALRPQDVKKVEIFDYPSDPRFMGDRHVVNFVMVRHTMGGYTKIDATQRFIGTGGNYMASSKLASQKLTLDVTAGATFSQSTHNGADTRSVYTFSDEEITRTSSLGQSQIKNNSEFAAARLIYTGSSITISNKIGFNRSGMPQYNALKTVAFTPAAYPVDNTTDHRSSSGVTPYWTGNYQWQMCKGYFLTFMPEVAYSHSSMKSIFSSDISSIRNDVTENTWSFQGRLMLQKSIGRQNLSVTLSGNHRSNIMDYTGNSPSHIKETASGFNARLGANLRFGNFWFHGTADLSFSKLTIGEEAQNNLFPKFFLSAGYRFNDRNQVSAYSELSRWNVPLSEMNPNMILLNNIDAIAGNPLLKPFRYNSVGFNYSTFLTQKLSLEIFGRYSRQNSPSVPVYCPTASDSHPYLMVRMMENNGSFTRAQYGGAATLKLLANSLHLRLSASGNTLARTGIGNYNRTDLHLEASCGYFIGEFNIQAGYTRASVSGTSAGWNRTPHFYFLAAGWGHNALFAGVRIANIFTSGYKSLESFTAQDAYHNTSTYYSDDYHRWISLSVSYSFSYAKKVKKTAAMDANYSIESGILR